MSTEQTGTIVPQANATETKKSNVATKKEKKSVVKKTDKKVDKINLSQFADKLSKVEVKEKRKKETIYIYPDGFSENDINSEKGKKHRNHLRTAMKRFSNNIQVYAKHKRVDDLKKEVKEFEVFYKKNYRLQDFSISSITNTKDESKEQSLVLMLDIIKAVKK